MLLTKGHEFQTAIEFGGGVITGQLLRLGVKYYENFERLKQDEYTQILSNVSVSGLLEDKQNNLFVTTLNNGVFYCKNIEGITRITTKHEVKALDFISDTTLFYTKDNTSINSIDLPTLKKKFIRQGRSYHDLKFTDDGKLYVMAHPSCEVKENNTWQDLELYDRPQSTKFPAKRIVQVKDEIWIIGPQDFHLYEQNINSKSLTFDAKIETISEFNDSLYLIGRNDGLFEFDLINMSSLKHLHLALAGRINDIVFNEGLYFIGVLGAGIIVWDGVSNFDLIDLKDGLISNNIEKLFFNNHKIYATTYSGLSVIDYKNSTEISITNYNLENGLPSNQVYDLAFRDNKIFVATGKGIVSIDESSEYSQKESTYQTLIETLLINNKIVEVKNKPSYHYSENNITIRYKALDIRSLGNIQYQYKLSDEWISTNENEVNFSKLAPGQYTFQVRMLSNSGQHGDITKLDWEIMPPWWQSKLFYLIIFSILSLVVFSNFKKKNSKNQAGSIFQTRNKGIGKDGTSDSNESSFYIQLSQLYSKLHYEK